MSQTRRDWRDGNRVALLENGEAFFPRVFEVIEAARASVYIETFILAADKVGNQLRAALCRAAKRGVQVDVLADGFGSPDVCGEFLEGLTAAGVRVHLFEPRRRLLGFRTNLFRRLHRKITLVDARLAFVGGINFCCDHLRESGPKALQDYAVEVEGPVVDDIVRFVQTSRSAAPWWSWRPRGRTVPLPSRTPQAGEARIKFVTRDNHRHPNDIEREYRVAIRLAREEVIVANAYFFPGYRLLRDLRNAARRGVRVIVVVQGEPDMPIVTIVARWLYHYLVPAGVAIEEYCERPLHAKVAIVDQRWATVGSSNLDPLSLSLNLEANVLIEDAQFQADLRQRLHALIETGCRPITSERVPKQNWWRVVTSWMVFHFLRHFPRWAGWLPAHRPRIEAVAPVEVEVAAPEDPHAVGR